MTTKNPFQATGVARLPRASFDLSHEYKTTQNMGQLIPISVFECVPGDVHKIGIGAVIRAQPLFAPIMHQVKLRTYAFFVPYRILFDDWEEFITRGEDGDSVVTLPVFDPDDMTDPAEAVSEGFLWDYLGYPVGVNVNNDSLPLDFPRRAYYEIWNEFFRVTDLQSEVDYINDGNAYKIYNRNWTRDYYTSALPWQQRGTPPALPVFGSLTATNPHTAGVDYQNFGGSSLYAFQVSPNSETHADSILVDSSLGWTAGQSANIKHNIQSALNENTVNITANLTTVDIADLRLAWQTQVWLERNARGGARYTEQLQVRYGTSPRDERLQRPEFIGGATTPLIFSEVLQTGETTVNSPQGNLAGHGITLQSGHLGNYRVQEHGLIMVLACIDPTPSYMGQGIERSWLRRTTFDFYAPEFAALSEQEIFNAEIYAQEDNGNTGINRDPFGYTGAFNELRYIPNKATNEMRSTFDYWHMSRKFASLPTLNTDFVNITNDEVNTELNRVFAVGSVPGWICNYGIRLISHRPLPYLAVPSAVGGAG